MRNTRPLNQSLKMHRPQEDGADENSFLASMTLLADTILWGQMATAHSLHYLVSGRRLQGKDIMREPQLVARDNEITKTAAGLANLFRVKKGDKDFRVSVPLSAEQLPEQMLANQTMLGRFGATVSEQTIPNTIGLGLQSLFDSTVTFEKTAKADLQALIEFIDSIPGLGDPNANVAEFFIDKKILYKEIDEDFIAPRLTTFADYEVNHKSNNGDTMIGVRMIWGPATNSAGRDIAGHLVPEEVRTIAGMAARIV